MHSELRGSRARIAVIHTLWLGVFVAVLGCGSDRPATAPVSGKISLGGEPVTTGRIMFRPGAGRASQGDIQTDGTYTLTTFEQGDGALPGKHRVTIRSTNIGRPVSQPDSLEAELAQGGVVPIRAGAIEWLVPESYSQLETSGLTADVPKKGDTIDFALP